MKKKEVEKLQNTFVEIPTLDEFIDFLDKESLPMDIGDDRLLTVNQARRFVYVIRFRSACKNSDIIVKDFWTKLILR